MARRTSRCRSIRRRATEPLQDTLLDLRANEAELVNGVALLNDRAIPFDLAARDLNAQVNYLRATDRYGITIDLNDLRTKMGKQPEAQSKLHLEARAGARHGAADEVRVRFGQGFGAACDGDAEPLCAAGVAGDGEWDAGAEAALGAGGCGGLTGGTVELDGEWA